MVPQCFWGVGGRPCTAVASTMLVAGFGAPRTTGVSAGPIWAKSRNFPNRPKGPGAPRWPIRTVLATPEKATGRKKLRLPLIPLRKGCAGMCFGSLGTLVRGGTVPGLAVRDFVGRTEACVCASLVEFHNIGQNGQNG
jgi:hypothetical protein